MQEQKRQRIIDLIHTGINPKTIVKTVGVGLATVYRGKNQYHVRGDVSRAPGTGQKRRIRNTAFLEALEAEVTDKPGKSMREIAKEVGMDEKTIRKAMHEDLSLKSYIRRQRQLPTTTNKANRVARCKLLVNWMKAHGSTIWIFSDKMAWTVDRARNAQNDRWLAFDPLRCPLHCQD